MAALLALKPALLVMAELYKNSVIFFICFFAFDLGSTNESPPAARIEIRTARAVPVCWMC